MSELLIGKLDEKDGTVVLFDDLENILSDDFVKTADGSIWHSLGGNVVKEQFKEYMSKVKYRVEKMSK